MRPHRGAADSGDCPSAINADDDEALVNYILRYINTHYNYNLLSDAQLRRSAHAH